MAASNSRSIAAEAAFLTRLGELGATLLEPAWLGSAAKHHVRCAQGHDCYPMPTSVQRGQGICRICAGFNPAATEAAFKAVLAELGARLLEPYGNSNAPHLIRCAAGHESRPRPCAVVQGAQGICRACNGNDSATAAGKFRDRIKSLGATLVEPGWLGSSRPHHVLCAAGHDCYPRPSGVAAGQGICRTCVGLDPVVAEANFRERLDGLGATLLEPYRNAVTPHRAICANGHECNPVPHAVVRGGGACITCAGQDPAVAEAAFRAALLQMGATLLEPYKSAQKKHRVRCAAGHECWPRPDVVRRGHGICAECAHKVWDVFYVVAHESEPRVKFGISNMTGRVRLGQHRRAGYSTVIRLVTGLPGSLARDTENAVVSALAMAGQKPVQGREYFDVSCLGLILDVADSWLANSDSMVA